eukprot:CAMPEP_0169383646 /NCGR_PEP_ID=MMETSP1017-20121227/42893_1 /TAXON_ID=342587 /ORGANISM="Karlodinium micrum, Strain CCMP2283" /LENGTH=86 /DNA_ID=CAMNT_0009483927 /DNA_START=10 /DNA_END=266 /DNA_ORIENTATION=+
MKESKSPSLLHLALVRLASVLSFNDRDPSRGHLFAVGVQVFKANMFCYLPLSAEGVLQQSLHFFTGSRFVQLLARPSRRHIFFLWR